MSHSSTKTADQWREIMTSKVHGLTGITDEGYIYFKEWYDLTYGKTPQQIADMFPGMSLIEATDMNVNFTVLKEFSDCMNNVAVSADDRKTKLAKFY